MKNYKSINSRDRFYKKYIKSENDWKELRKILIFARAHLCSSNLLWWGSSDRQLLINKEKNDKRWKLLTRDGIDSYYVKNFGDGSINYLTEKRKEITERQLEELMVLIEKTEQFIKEELEKGTKFEGEFDEWFPRYIEGEEEKWKYYEIKKKIKSGEIK